jgi:Leu/Phe-tRNA-protein transferase|tara:strand:+ start:343 stop:603 length:261 start_codon:yes stop_codon:yes gene_type:complete
MSFVKEFDPKKEDHVIWLQKVDTVMLHVTDQMNASKDMMKIVNENPFGIKMKNPMDWAQSHFQLCMKYSQAVLRGLAHIPTRGATD